MTLKQRIEPFVAWLAGAPVKSRSGRVYQRRKVSRELYILVSSLFGFDFSKWQGVIDFLKVYTYGAMFIILRASYGITGDERFVENMPKCLEYFPNHTSVYHYYDPQYSPQAQYNRLITMIAPYKASIKRVWIDLEFTWSGSYSAASYWKQFAELLLSAGYKIGFYTRKTWWDSRVGSLFSWFGQYPCWAAQYNTSLTMIPLGWSKADLWQNGTPAIGTEVGTGSLEVDYDIADDDFYYSEYGGTQPPTGEPMTYKLKVNAPAGLNGRGTLGGVTKDKYQFGDILTAESSQTYNGAVWHKIVAWESNGTPKTMAVVPEYASEGLPTDTYYPYLLKIDQPVPPPPTVIAVTDIIVETAPGTIVTIKKSDGSQIVIPG